MSVDELALYKSRLDPRSLDEISADQLAQIGHLDVDGKAERFFNEINAAMRKVIEDTGLPSKHMVRKNRRAYWRRIIIDSRL